MRHVFLPCALLWSQTDRPLGPTCLFSSKNDGKLSFARMGWGKGDFEGKLKKELVLLGSDSLQEGRITEGKRKC